MAAFSSYGNYKNDDDDDDDDESLEAAYICGTSPFMSLKEKQNFENKQANKRASDNFQDIYGNII